jgi:hypothetical protein
MGCRVSYEVEIEYKYETPGQEITEATHKLRMGKLEAKVPQDKIGDVTYLEYREIAAQQALAMLGETHILPTGTRHDGAREFGVIPKEYIISITARTVKTLDLE